MRRSISFLMFALATGILSIFSPVASAATSSSLSAAPAPQGAFGVRLVDAPVSEADNPRALRYIIDYLPTGTVIHRRILIANEEARTARFTVYADAAHITGGQFVGDAGATRSELTGWVSVQHPVVTLAAGASVTDMVTINVPSGATRGEHYGVVWVQQAAKARTGSGSAVIEVSRVGVRIYLAVGRGGAPPTSFDITSVTGHLTDAGQPVIVAHVNNTGGRAIDLNGTVRLADGPGNTSSGPFSARQDRHPRARAVVEHDLRRAKEPARRLLAGHDHPGQRVDHGHGHGHHPAQRDRGRAGGPVSDAVDLARTWRLGRRPRGRHGVVRAAAPAPSSSGLTV